jgi:hypothetical protein
LSGFCPIARFSEKSSSAAMRSVNIFLSKISNGFGAYHEQFTGLFVRHFGCCTDATLSATIDPG